MGREGGNKSEGSSCKSLVSEALEEGGVQPCLSVPSEPGYVYPASSFPPLETFEISVQFPALVIPARRTGELRKKLQPVLLHREKLKVVHSLDESDPLPGDVDRKHYRKIVLVDRKDVYEEEVVQELLNTSEFCKATHTVTSSYADWTVEQVLRRVLPLAEVPSAFEIVGHLAHLNLRDESLPFKYIVGKVVLDKNSPRIRTVVNKVGTIETEFRTFGMEVIAGNGDPGWSRVSVKEEGCIYELDFTKVYWNSRLGGEHRRLVEIIRQDARTRKGSDGPLVVADLMAGIGPFAVPLSSKEGSNIHVHANDLNPSSYEYLLVNSEKNKCQNLICYNMDARGFCHQLQDQDVDFHHVLMNLPATAPEFLDAFRGFIGKTLPRIHVHCFSSKKEEEAHRDTVERCATALGCSLNKADHNVVIHTVRNVAPNKNMYCVSFDLPKEVRNLPRISVPPQKEEPEQQRKRTKLN